MKYRDHRGGLSESLKTTIMVSSEEALLAHLNNGWKLFGRTIEEIKFEHIGMDDRTRWDTYYVLQRLNGEDDFVVAGMSNNKF